MRDSQSIAFSIRCHNTLKVIMEERPRDSHGYTVYQPFTRPGDGTMRVSDALLIGELDTMYLSADNKNLHLRKGERLVISTPNANYLPHVNLGNQVISMCVDGRWGAEDWGQWPQWYFDGQEHFPYILRKPAKKDLDSHPLRRLWWNISESDFQRDPGSKSFGMLLPNIAQELYDIRTNLIKEVEACVCSNALDYQKLHDCATKMRHCVSSLYYTPQPFTSAHLTTIAAQRYCLELRAILDKIAIHRKSIPSPDSPSVFSSDGPSPVDNTRLGCISDRVPVLCELHEKGIPVWYVRPSSEVSFSTNIVKQAPTIRPAHCGIETKRWPGAPIFYQGPLSRQIHAGIENWQPGNLQLNLLGRGSQSESSTEASQQKSTQKSHRSQPYSKEKAVARTTLKKPNLPVNLDLFKDPDTPYFPKLLDSWKKALTEVKIDILRVIDHPDAKLFRGFAFPPRGIFCVDDEERILEHMLGWLVIRSGWMNILSDPSYLAPLPNSQQWRTYLRGVALDLELVRPDNRRQASGTAATSSSSHSARRGGKLKEAAKEIFTQPLPRKEDVQILTWNSRIVWRRTGGPDFPAIDRQRLVWDTEEHSFCAELTTLDHLIMRSAWLTDEGRKIRSLKISAMWPDGGVANLSLPSESTGIAAEDWVKRCPYVEAFRKIVMDWPGDIPRVLAQLSFVISSVNGLDRWDKPMMEKVERLAAAHYCQVFFDHFGRAPCIPRIFPVG